MGKGIKNIFIRIGSILALIFGIIIFIGLVGLGLYFIFSYSDGDLQRKAIVGIAIFVAAIVELTVTIAIFEALSEIVHLEKLEDQLGGNKKWTDQ